MIFANRVKPDPCLQNVTNRIICCCFSSDLSGYFALVVNYIEFRIVHRLAVRYLRHFNQFVPIVYRSRHVSKQGRIRSEDSCGDPIIDSALLALETFEN